MSVADWGTRVAVITALATLTAPLHGQLPQDSARRLEVRVSASFDRQLSNHTVIDRYLSGSRDSIVRSRVAQGLQTYLRARFTEAAYKGVTVRLSSDTFTLTGRPPDITYEVDAKLWIDADRALRVTARAGSLAGGPPLFKRDTILLPDISTDWDGLSAWPAQDPRAERELSRLADRVVGQIGAELYSAVTEATVRLRVRVHAASSPSAGKRPDLGPFLTRAVEGELARSAAFFVLRGGGADNTGISTNYEVEVSHEFIGAKVRVDVRCVKSGRDGRLLTSRYIVTDTSDVERLSLSLAGLVYGIRHAMEADFASSTRTLAVVATSSSERLRLKTPSKRDIAVAREVMRAAAQKTRLLTTAGGRGLLNLQVISDVPAADSTSWTSPSEILAASDAEYLLLLTYQDLGERVRLTADLHSFELERAAAGVYIDEAYVDLSQLGPALDTLIAKLCKHLIDHDLNLGKGPATECTSDSTYTVLRSVKLRSLERTRQFALRTGSSVYRSSPELFLGRQGGFYIELSYAARPPFLRHGRPGGRFDAGFEATLGLESSSLFGPMLSFEGPAVATALLSAIVTITPWAYTSTTFNMTVGLSGGLKGFRWNLRPGDQDFVGTMPYRQSAFVPVWGGFAEFDIPMSFAQGVGVNIVTRWLPATRKVTEFVGLPLRRFETTGGPTGTLGSVYLAGGLAYRF